MSVWQDSLSHTAALTGSEGDLVSISINVEPRRLESLLEALAQLDFPINPEIYHEAEVDYIYADGREESQPVTVVEFPAYAPRVAQVRDALHAFGFDPETAQVSGMLDHLYSEWQALPAPAGAPYQFRILRKQPHRKVAAVH